MKMATNKMKTDFAPAERLEDGDVYLQTIKFLGMRNLIQILNILPNLVAVVNKERQVIFMNDAFMEGVESDIFEDCLGQRPGELFTCIHSMDNPGGCGTGKYCRHCGAVLTMLKAQETGKKTERNAEITVNRNGEIVTINMHLVASPITVDNEIFYILVMTLK